MNSGSDNSTTSEKGYDAEAMRLARHDKELTNCHDFVQMIIRVLDFATAYKRPFYRHFADGRIVNVGVGSFNTARYFEIINSPQSGQTALPRPGSIVLWPSYFCLVVA